MVRIITAIVALVLAGGIFFFYTQPAYDTVQTAQAQINDYNAALDKAAELQQLKQSLLSRYNAFDPGSLDRLQKLLPDNVDNIGLILELDNLAGRYGLALQNVDVSTADSQTPAGGAAIGAIAGANQNYSSLTLTFGTAGSYDSFVKFLTNLESSLRVVDLVSLTIASGASTNQGTIGHTGTAAQPSYTYNIILRTYWLK